jgi:hypothetical protein
MLDAPTPMRGSIATNKQTDNEEISDADIQNMLSKLKA